MLLLSTLRNKYRVILNFWFYRLLVGASLSSSLFIGHKQMFVHDEEEVVEL